MAANAIPIFAPNIVKHALVHAFTKLAPRRQIHNPVMFTVYMGAILTTVLFIMALNGHNDAPIKLILSITLWLWFTVIFANFAEAMAEGRGKAQANELRKSRKEITAKQLSSPSKNAKITPTPSAQLTTGDIVLVEAGDIIPSDGEIIEGIASINESAITGESAPVIRESGGDRSAVTGGTSVLSDWLIVRITAKPGATFLDHMIALVEGAKRQKTPNELALAILLAALTFVFLMVCATLLPYSIFSVNSTGSGNAISITVLVALFVCLAPTTIGALLSTIGIAGMDRMAQANIIALTGHSIEVAGDVDVLFLDKTGTITLGNRQATEFIPDDGIGINALAEAAYLASVADDTAEGKSITALARDKYAIRSRSKEELNAHFIPFTAESRISGIHLGDRKILKGSPDAIAEYMRSFYKKISPKVLADVERIARRGGTPLVVVSGDQILGTINLKDIIKSGIRERFAALRQIGIKTVMITGDNQLTSATIAGEAGVDDFIANATPEQKIKYIREMQDQGHLIAMAGDGTNDAPALAQADVGVAMNTGTQAAKEASNLIDLESDPTRIIEVVEIGKQLLITRGALTTFSIANDVAKYFAILPAAFASTYPILDNLNIMRLHSPSTAILSAVIFNAIIIVLLVPLALRGVKYKPSSASQMLRRNVLIYGFGGLLVPFIGIKLIDMLLARSIIL